MAKLAARRWTAFLTCLFMIVSIFNPVVTYAEQSALVMMPALDNPGFEKPAVSGVIPGWTQIFGVGSNGTVTVDGGNKNSGASSLKIVDNDAVNFGVESNKMRVIPGVVYKASSMWFIQGGSVQLQIRFYDANQKLLSSDIIVNDPNFTSQPTGKWFGLSAEGTAPANAMFATVVLVSGKSAKGTSYADDISFTRTIPVVNAGFEDSAESGGIPGWTLLLGSGNAGGIFKDNSVVRSGLSSLRLEDRDAVSFAAESTKVEVTPDAKQTVTASVYIASASVQLQIRYYDEANKLTGTIAVNDPNYTSQPVGQWQQLTVKATAPSAARTASIVLASPKTAKGVSYWDDLRFEEEVSVLREPDPKPEDPPPAQRLHLTNGSFEEPLSGTAIPGWKVNYGNTTITSAQAFEGKQSLYVQNTANTGAGISMESEMIDIQEGETYVLTSRIMLQRGAFEGFYVYVYDDAGKLIKSSDGKDFHLYANLLTPGGEWTTIEKTFTVQPGGKKLKLSYISGKTKNYEIYLDEVAITRAVRNGDFEREGINGAVPGWSKFNEATDASSFGITGEQFFSGSKSLYLENEPGKYLNVVSDLIDVEPGKTYTALAKTYIEYGSADMYVRFFDSKGVYIGQQAWSIKSEPLETWFTNFVKTTVPAGAAKAAIMFAGSNSKTYKYYVDEVKLLQGDHGVKEIIVPENSITKLGQDLGVQIRKATLMRGDYGKDGRGRDVLYTVVAGSPSVFTIIDIETEQVVLSMPMENTSGAWSVKVSTDGTVYLGAYNLGLLYRYFPQTGELRNLGHPLPTKDSVLYPMDSGKDGKMYGGNYPSGSVYEYDPATNTFTDFGTMALRTSGERWVRVTVYDPETHKIYAGVGNQPRLVEYDIATGTKRDLLPPQYSDIIAVYDLNLIDGRLFARKEANNANETFVVDVKTGQLVEVTNGDTGQKGYEFISFSRGVSPKSPVDNTFYYAGEGGKLFAYNLDTNTYRSLGVTIEGAAIGYGYVQLQEDGFPGYSLVGLSGNGGKMFKYNLQTGKVKLTDVMVPAEPVNVHDIIKGPDGNIYTGGYLQGNVGVYSPTTGRSRYLNGIGQSEGITSIGDKLFFGVYPDAKIYEYDMSKPWNRDNAEKLNPFQIFSLKENAEIPGYTLQDRPFAMAGSAALNKLFVGTVPKNSLLGGALAVYDLTVRGQPQVYWNIVPDQSILSLVEKDGMLYGGTSIHGGQGGTPKAKEAALFVWDVARGVKTFEVVPVPGKQAITALHLGPDGNIWGLANGAPFIFDPISKSVIFSKDYFPDANGRWIDGSMDTGTDGNVYATVGGRFFKIDAVTKAITVLATEARKLAQDDFGNFYIFTVPTGPNLYKYSDPQLLVKLTGAELSIPEAKIHVGDELPVSILGILEKGRTTREMSGAVISFAADRPDAVSFGPNNQVRALQPGSVNITATVTLDGRTVQSSILTLRIYDKVNVTVEPAAAAYSDEAVLTARIKDSLGRPVDNAAVQFSVQGIEAGTASTNSEGIAKLAYKAMEAAGEYRITTSVKPDAVRLYDGAEGTGTLYVTKELAAVVYTGSAAFQAGSTGAALTATVVQSPDGSLGNVNGLPMTFSISRLKSDGSLDRSMVLGEALTDDTGKATVRSNLQAGIYELRMTLMDNRYYEAAETVAMIAVSDLNAGRLSMNGFIRPSHAKDSLFSEKIQFHLDLQQGFKDGDWKAELHSEPRGPKLKLLTIHWIALFDNEAYVQGTATDDAGSVYTLRILTAERPGNEIRLTLQVWQGDKAEGAPLYQAVDASFSGSFLLKPIISK